MKSRGRREERSKKKRLTEVLVGLESGVFVEAADDEVVGEPCTLRGMLLLVRSAARRRRGRPVHPLPRDSPPLRVKTKPSFTWAAPAPSPRPRTSSLSLAFSSFVNFYFFCSRTLSEEQHFHTNALTLASAPADTLATRKKNTRASPTETPFIVIAARTATGSECTLGSPPDVGLLPHRRAAAADVRGVWMVRAGEDRKRREAGFNWSAIPLWYGACVQLSRWSPFFRFREASLSSASRSNGL